MVSDDLHSVPDDRWEAAIDCSTRSSIRWIPVFRFPKSGTRLGLRNTGEWAFETKEGLKTTSVQTPGPALFPFLEFSESSALTQIHQSLAQVGLSPRFEEKLPLKKTVHTALRIGSAYWEHLALCWVAEWHDDDETAPLLREVVKRGLTQQNRHLAKRILKKWSRGDQSDSLK